MDIEKKEIECKGIKFFTEVDGREVGRAYLYILPNDLHKKPFGFLEDVHVDKSQRRNGIATQLLNELIKEARRMRCYKIVATSRYTRENVHKLYEHLGFKKKGIEFRLDFDN